MSYWQINIEIEYLEIYEFYSVRKKEILNFVFQEDITLAIQEKLKEVYKDYKKQFESKNNSVCRKILKFRPNLQTYSQRKESSECVFKLKSFNI